MASHGASSSGDKVKKKRKLTANQLGFRVDTLVRYKGYPYHIVAISKAGDTVTIKRCDNPSKIRDDVTLDRISLVEFRDPLYNRWALSPVKADFSRTREDELFTIKALVDSTRNCGKEIRRDVLMDVIKRNGWLGVWLLATYQECRQYRLKSWHVIKVWDDVGVDKVPESIFTLLAKLQFNKLKPLKAAKAWKSMLLQMDESVWEVANMVLDRQLGDLTYNDVRYAMIQMRCVPWLDKKKPTELFE